MDDVRPTGMVQEQNHKAELTLDIARDLKRRICDENKPALTDIQLNKK